MMGSLGIGHSQNSIGLGKANNSLQNEYGNLNVSTEDHVQAQDALKLLNMKRNHDKSFV